MNACEHFEVEQYDEVLVVRLVDTKYFDTDSYTQLQHELVDFVEREQPRKLAVDFTRVGYCSTAVINSLLMIKRRVESGGGRLKIFGLSEVVQETLERLKLTDSLLDVYANEAAARDSF